MKQRHHLLLACILLAAALEWRTVLADEIDDLEDYLDKNGGFFDWRVGQACPTCARGTFAKKDYVPEDLIAVTPLSAAVGLGVHGFENGDLLYEKLLVDPEFNATFDAFWRTQPGPELILGLEMFTPALLKLLQSDTLQTIIRANQAARSTQFFSPGGVRDRIIAATNRTVVPSFAQYNYVSSIVTSRAFAFTNPETDEPNTYLLPAIDLINHSTKRVNVERRQEDRHIEIVAVANISAGEELLYEYDPGVVHRIDMCLLVYGFVPDDEDEKQLCAIDVPGFQVDNPYEHTPRVDDLASVDLKEERVRVAKLLADAERQTTLAQDRQLLADLQQGRKVPGTEGWGWKEAEIIKFRVRRKYSLHARLADVEAALAQV